MGKIKKSEESNPDKIIIGRRGGGDIKKLRHSTTAVVPRGRPKSGRVWKQVNHRATSIKKFKRDSVLKKQADREEAKKVKELSQALRNAKKNEIIERKQRIAENKRRKEENTKKSEIVQVIKNPAKLKRMKKKQLRKIEKRDTTILSKKKSISRENKTEEG